MRSACAAGTRGAWRAGGVRDGVSGTLVAGAPASFAVWDADDVEVGAPDNAVQRWSTDPRSRVPALPRLDSAGVLSFRFGGRLQVNGEQEGDFRGDLPITAEYL